MEGSAYGWPQAKRIDVVLVTACLTESIFRTSRRDLGGVRCEMGLVRRRGCLQDKLKRILRKERVVSEV